MGKTKQAKEKKFDRNVEISAPILDPEIIKAIHSPPRGQRLDMKHGGFKALLSDLNSQDSTDEMSPLNENHVPSYIGISCAVSGYSNYSSYSKRPSASPISELRTSNNNNINNSNAHNRSRTTSPTAHKSHQPEHPQIHHITVDKNNIQSPDAERKELTEKLIASATEHRRDPSPIPPTEDDRHHGTYVGARYFPMPPPDKVVNKHIPLLGIDDDQNPDNNEDNSQVNKVEQKIANLYGDDFVEDWRESMTHKAKKELAEDNNRGEQQANIKNPKDLVTLKPTPVQTKKAEEVDGQQMADVPTPNAKVLAGVEKQFLNKLLTDENPPTPSPPPYLQSPVKQTTATKTRRDSPTIQSTSETPTKQELPTHPASPIDAIEKVQETSNSARDSLTEIPQTGEEHIEYEIRAQSPVDNLASPVRIRSSPEPESEKQRPSSFEENLVSLTPEPVAATVEPIKEEDEGEDDESDSIKHQAQPIEQQQLSTESEINGGSYYLNLLDQEKSFILSQIAEAEATLSAQESELDEDTIGRIRSAIGKANLLLNKKCNQFKELCESNMNANAYEQHATLNDDLAGFWDMIRIQIEDVRKSFENIWVARENNWNTEVGSRPADSGSDESRESSLKDRASKPKLSAQKDQERRERLKEHINQMKQNQVAKNSSATLIGEPKEVIADLEQVGCDVIETVAPAETESATRQFDQQVEEAEEQLFSLMGSTSPSPPPPAAGEQEQQEPTSEKPNENLLDLLD